MASSSSFLIPILFTILSLLFVISSSLDPTDDDVVMARYESWLVKHAKNYNALGEKQRRFQIFKDNLRYIQDHNSKNLSFKLGLNSFADLTNEEYRSRYLGRVESKPRLTRSKSDRYAFRVGDSVPDSIDWRVKGAVVPVKDQGSCGGSPFTFIFFQLHLRSWISRAKHQWNRFQAS